MKRVLPIWLALLLLAAAVHAEEPPAVTALEVDLVELSRIVAKATGRTILFGPEFSGTAVIVGARDEYTPDELWEVYLAALAKNGWGVVVHGRVVRVTRRDTMSQQGGAVIETPTAGEDTPVPADEDMVTATIEMDNLDPGMIAMSLAPLVEPDGKLVPLPAFGRLVVVAPAAQVERVRAMIAKLDTPDRRETVEVVRLKRAGVQDVADILARLFTDYEFADDRLRPRDTAGGLVVVPESGSGSIAMRGAQRDVGAAARLAERLDAADDALALVRRLKHADTQELFQTLNDLLK